MKTLGDTMVYLPLETRVRQKAIDVHWKPDLTYDPSSPFNRLDAEARVTLDVLEPIPSLRVHAADLELQRAVLRLADGTVLPARRWEFRSSQDPNAPYDPHNESVELHFDRDIPIGEATLEVVYTGRLNDDLKGPYRSTYTGRDGTPKIMFATQFEATYGRMAIPMIDEPAAKAVVTTHITVPEGVMAVSNMPLISSESAGNGMVTHHFAPTPPMSPYLIAGFAAELDATEGEQDGIPFRVLTTPGKSHLTPYALKVAMGATTFFADFFGTDYDLPKIDLVAVPDFAFGAMENWGAISFLEVALLTDEATSSRQEKLRVSVITSHELTHQWFGDRVTMRWWNGLWLNEGFADWMGYLAADHIAPALDPWSEFLGGRAMSAYTLDSLVASHPVQADVTDPGQASELFDAVSYSKGGMALRMLMQYVGVEDFRAGLKLYFDKHKFGNTEDSDLWAALETASGKPVSAMMDSWISQIGHPLVDVSLEGRTLRLSQRRFLFDGQGEGVWQIPVTVEYNGGKKATLFLTEREGTIELDEAPTYVKVNSGEFVFHRTRYSPELLSGLEAVIANKRIGHHDRWGVHRDLAAMAVSGDVTIEEYLGFVERAFANEDHLLVLTNVLSALGKLGVVARGEPYHPRIGALVETLSKKTLDRMDWDVKDGEDPSDRALRADAILRLGRLGDERAVSWARDAFPRASELESNLRGAVYGISAWRGDERTFDTLLQRYKSETNPQERMKILSAGLAGFQDPALLRKALDTSLTDAIRHQDRMYLVRDMTAHGPGLDAAWHWFQETWQPKVSRLYEKGGNHVALMLHGLAPLASEDRALELESIFGQNPVSGSVAAIKQTTEEMRALAKMVKRNRSI